MRELDPLLNEYARGIVDPNLQFGHRPACIDSIVAKIRAYQAPTNSVTAALQEIRTKYSISDSDLANLTTGSTNQSAASVPAPPSRTAGTQVQSLTKQTAISDVSEGAPTVPVATASSVLAAQLGNRYGAENVLDGRLDTAWVEGVSGPGVGEWLQIEFPTPTLISQVEIFPGYGKNQTSFEKNNRPRTLELRLMDEHFHFEGGSGQTIHLEDTARWQTYSLPVAMRTKGVRLVIVDVYRGSAYDDTAISEVRFR